jgi:DNA-binding transcriptional LysR family regulator
LRTLVAIADRGSFADAARALHLAPTTVSLHIAELEERIGAPLLSRKRGHLAIGSALRIVRGTSSVPRNTYLMRCGVCD